MRLAMFLLLAIPPQDGDGLSALVEVLKEANEVDFQLDILKGLKEGLKGKQNLRMPAAWPQVAAKLEKSPNGEVRSLTQAVSIAFGDPRAFESFRKVLADFGADAAARKGALESLLLAKDAGLLPILKGLLKDAALRGPAIRALAAYDDAGIPALLLEVYGSLDVAEKRDALNTLAARAAYARDLVGALRKKAVPRSDLTAATVRQLLDHKDASVDKWITEEWGMVRTTPEEKKKEIEKHKQLILAGPKGDPRRGRAHYAKTCGQCHTLFDAGGKVGPELTGANRNDLDYLFHNILDPSAEVGKDYQASTIRTKGERILSGIIRTQDKDSLTIQTENDTVLIAAGDIDVIKPSEVSMMPEGLLTPLSPADVRDLIAYLQSPVQVQPPTPEIKSLFNGKDLAGWEGNPELWKVENGEIVGKHDGLKRNEFLRSTITAADFRLLVDVKLVGNKGNSGVQFRSELLKDGVAVKGYQADVAGGWWGKLYEERGRGLLAKEGADKIARLEGWNTYEILALGNKITLVLNGHVTNTIDDPAGAKSGIIALQVHAGGGMEVRFRNITLETNPLRSTPLTLESFWNGKDLNGWTGNPSVWSVEGGELVGKGPQKKNEFLFSDIPVADFRIVFEVKLVPNGGNSGFQFRSERLADGHAKGYQADIGKGWWGKLYDEHARGLLSAKGAEDAVKADDWNTYEILAVGNRIKTAINGQPATDFEDPKAVLRGLLAPQVHSGGPMEVRFRNFKLELNPGSELVTVK